MAQSRGVRGSYPRAVSLGMGVPTGTVSGQEAVTVGSGQAGQPRRGREGDSNGGGSTGQEPGAAWSHFTEDPRASLAQGWATGLAPEGQGQGQPWGSPALSRISG